MCRWVNVILGQQQANDESYDFNHVLRSHGDFSELYYGKSQDKTNDDGDKVS